MRQSRKKRTYGKRTHSDKTSGCAIVIVILLILICFGFLYHPGNGNAGNGTAAATEKIQEWDVSEEKSAPSNRKAGVARRKRTKRALPAISAEELEIPLSTAARQEQVVRHTGYTVSYNKNLKIPNWVSYERTREEVQGTEKRSNRFTADPLVTGSMATNNDYKYSGYDKGHMAPAADMKWDREVMKESFYFSNVCPQHPQLNRKGWEDLENKVREWAMADSAIIIVCGPIVWDNPRTIGNKVAVPQQFFKVILSPFMEPVQAIGFLFNNEPSTGPLSAYAVSVDSIEHLTRLDFFSALPDDLENKIEAEADYLQWARSYE